MSMRDYELLSTIGRGNFGVVYLAQHKQTGRKYVIKSISLRDISTSEREAALQEVQLLSTLQHPFIVQYKESFLDSNDNANEPSSSPTLTPSNSTSSKDAWNLHIVMHFCEGGDLASQIRTQAATGQHHIIQHHIIHTNAHAYDIRGVV